MNSDEFSSISSVIQRISNTSCFAIEFFITILVTVVRDIRITGHVLDHISVVVFASKLKSSAHASIYFFTSSANLLCTRMLCSHAQVTCLLLVNKLSICL